MLYFYIYRLQYLSDAAKNFQLLGALRVTTGSALEAGARCGHSPDPQHIPPMSAISPNLG